MDPNNNTQNGQPGGTPGNNPFNPTGSVFSAPGQTQNQTGAQNQNQPQTQVFAQPTEPQNSAMSAANAAMTAPAGNQTAVLPNQPVNPAGQTTAQPQNLTNITVPEGTSFDPNAPVIAQVAENKVDLESPVVAPTHFDGFQKVDFTPATPEQINQMNQQAQQKQPKPEKPPLDPQVVARRFTILSIVMGVFAIIGIALGIWGIIDATNTNNILAKAQEDLNNKNAIISQIEYETGKTITSVDELPSYAAITDYIYLTEWGIKIKIPATLQNISYTLDENYRQHVCFTGYESNVTVFPAFADIKLNPEGLGCLYRIKITEGNQDENGVSFGEPVYTYGDYRYFYNHDDGRVFSETDAEKGLEATAVQLIKTMLTSPEYGVSHFE